MVLGLTRPLVILAPTALPVPVAQCMVMVAAKYLGLWDQISSFVHYLMVLPVFMRTHCGIGRFCFIFFASLDLILNDLWAACKQDARERSSFWLGNTDWCEPRQKDLLRVSKCILDLDLVLSNWGHPLLSLHELKCQPSGMAVRPNFLRRGGGVSVTETAKVQTWDSTVRTETTPRDIGYNPTNLDQRSVLIE